MKKNKVKVFWIKLIDLELCVACDVIWLNNSQRIISQFSDLILPK